MPDILAPAAERGRLDVHPRVVEAVGRRSAGEVEGVVPTRPTGLDSLVRHRLPGADARDDAGRARLEVQVATLWGRPAADVAGRVQRHVAARVTELTGLPVEAVHVTVAAVVVPEDRHDRRVL
ncbi:Asp23/Gls24 family envelope stress response protein [Aquipuribacter hungaricus]|uniref:Asp23/Gls24 family envelope stress response protein n=1 Tax=Aquipuribacter hungaricus TaxID=545624 RepID=A0ABV7WKH5_9MICO